MPLTQFNPPGNLPDLTEAHRPLWSDWISSQLDDAAKGSAAENDGPRHQFFNPLRAPAAADAAEADISWTAFPRIIQLSSASDAQRWKKADASRDNQDEYCEWSVERHPTTDKIVRVTFTSEGPEYWEALAAWQPETVLELYQQHVSPRVRREDLFPNGRYDRRNVWNNSTQRGAMHLIQRNNSLGAEIELAAAATIVRRRNGTILTKAQELIRCSQYGAAERHSDPHIGASVNAFARQGAHITLADPVGLCIADLATFGWVAPDQSDPKSYWTITRGDANKALRAVYEVPAARGFTVGDIQINGRPIATGAQIADFITIKLTGLATRIDPAHVRVFDGCRGAAAVAAAGFAGPPKLADILSAAGPGGRR
jgi:hypothetical protein